MTVRVTAQVGNLLHAIHVQDSEAATALVARVYKAKMEGRSTYQIDATMFLELPVLALMKIG